MATIEIGETTILADTDSGNASKIQAQLANLPVDATIDTISYYVVTAAGNIRLAIYDATGTAGGPGSLKAETASTVAIGPNTWNILPVVTPVLLTLGNYWLAWQNSSGTLANKWNSGSSGSSSADNGFAYAAFPSTFTIDAGGTANWSISAQLTTAASSVLLGSYRRMVF